MAQYRKKLKLSEGDLILITLIDNPKIKVVYKVLGYKQLDVDSDSSKTCLCILLSRCSYSDNYVELPELPCKQFVFDEEGIKIQNHRVKKLNREEAILEVVL